jgi:hypothetical protein
MNILDLTSIESTPPGPVPSTPTNLEPLLSMRRENIPTRVPTPAEEPFVPAESIDAVDAFTEEARIAKNFGSRTDVQAFLGNDRVETFVRFLQKCLEEPRLSLICEHSGSCTFQISGEPAEQSVADGKRRMMGESHADDRAMFMAMEDLQIPSANDIEMVVDGSDDDGTAGNNIAGTSKRSARQRGAPLGAGKGKGETGSRTRKGAPTLRVPPRFRLSPSKPGMYGSPQKNKRRSRGTGPEGSGVDSELPKKRPRSGNIK